MTRNLIFPLHVIRKVVSECCIDIRTSFRIFKHVKLHAICTPVIEHRDNDYDDFMSNSSFVQLRINPQKGYIIARHFDNTRCISIRIYITIDQINHTYFSSDYHKKYTHTTLTIQS